MLVEVPTQHPEAPRSLLGLSQTELSIWAESQGQPAYRGRQIHDWIYAKGARSLDEITVLPKQWRAQMAEFPVGRSQIHYRSVAADDTVKFLLRLSDGETVEAVGIPTAGRLTVCVSSQVGCPMACDFCATGKGGFQRNLYAHEIVDQVLTVQEDMNRRVNNIVFMGMGEPLLNAEQVVRTVQCLNHDVGISQRGMTISTVGVPGQIRRLAEHHLQATLAVSLHASNQPIRERLIPSARKYPLEALLAECQEYVTLTGRRVTFEYILLAELNDEPEHAVELANHLRGFQSHVNLIPYNPISEVDYQRPSPRRIQQFVQALEDRHIAVSVRRTRGLEADAACGQLRRRQTS
ncbi:23S rRNA (adenine(2503)-C(2))-methyltransferase RlmN [Leptolyngbya sp. FACHB-261]|uniref:23S rRNA (adenine(2503)-C(2))-methyltransferase RlmN n=1 Tax=Leptolyngbya sp. FACHB-261 TaxID=2692806 RepID=UPI0016888BD8|nr:23S rRNA (adenine(2503)-C(2))-methyltransferase RlmN [Leptolyngbya sp. FACHB-261]MBD2103462.1 23S rRNA (adenine(2503)-C(2))-methyltransferase RlmN [Leptolyngbya sp. FACHB-261]